MSPFLSLQQVNKSFQSKKVIHDLSFTFEKGCYCIYGANGIGKTTVLEMLAGIEQADSGTITLQRIESDLKPSLNFKKQLCYVPSTPHFFPNATGDDFINYISSVKSQEPTTNTALQELIRGFKLEEYLNCKYFNMSLGTQKKLFLTTLAIGENSIVILDEPSNGLDIHSCEVLVDFLLDKIKHSIVIIVTHDASIFSVLNPKLIKLTISPIHKIEISSEGK